MKRYGTNKLLLPQSLKMLQEGVYLKLENELNITNMQKIFSLFIAIQIIFIMKTFFGFHSII